MFYTYIHIRNDTGKIFYVGKGVRDRAWRTGDRNKHWRRIVAKAGYTVEVLARWKTNREALDHEIFLIATMRSLGCPLINLTDGGEGTSGYKPTPERIAKQVQQSKLNWSKPEYREKVVAALNDPERIERWRDRFLKHWETHPDKRKLAAEKQRAFAATEDGRRQAAAATAAKQTPEHKKRLAEVGRARHQTPEGREQQQRITEAALRPEAIEKAKAARKRLSQQPGFREAWAAARGTRPFRCDQTGEVFLSQVGAAEALGVSRPHLCQVLSGKRRSTRGYTFTILTPSTEPLSPTA